MHPIILVKPSAGLSKKNGRFSSSTDLLRHHEGEKVSLLHFRNHVVCVRNNKIRSGKETSLLLCVALPHTSRSLCNSGYLGEKKSKQR